MGIRKPKVSAREARQLAGQIPNKDGERVSSSAPGAIKAPRKVKAPSPAPVAATTAEKPPNNAKAAAASSSAVSAPRAVPVKPIRNAKTQVFLSAIIPAPGVSKSFDELSRYYPASKALQMILRRAMSDYEILLANGRFAKSTMAYPVPDGRPDQLLVQTSRSMPNELIEVATSHFDPLGFESKRAFGLKLATAALATFFKNER
ncbi:MAG: VirC2 family conjugal transfer protein [Pseudomonadota bacterium]